MTPQSGYHFTCVEVNTPDCVIRQSYQSLIGSGDTAAESSNSLPSSVHKTELVSGQVQLVDVTKLV